MSRIYTHKGHIGSYSADINSFFSAELTGSLSKHCKEMYFSILGKGSVQCFYARNHFRKTLHRCIARTNYIKVWFKKDRRPWMMKQNVVKVKVITSRALTRNRIKKEKKRPAILKKLGR